MIIVCFIYFDNSLFWPLYGYIPNAKTFLFSYVRMKNPLFKSENIKEKINVFACGALAASISVGIVIPSTWFVYLYKQTVSITVVVLSTVIKPGLPHKLNRIEYELHLAL